MFIGIGTSLMAGLKSSANPASLFAASEPGAWYDPSDITTLFQNSAGTTPVTAPNQTVGLMLDKSRGLALGSELVVNGNPFVAANWTTSNECSISGGVINCTTVVGANAQAYQGIASYSTAKAYQITINVTALTGTLEIIASTSTYTVSITTPGVKVLTLRPTATDYPYITARFLTGASGSISSISLKELAGNHATQATAGQRPTYGINPITGTRNLLTYTEQFDNAAWSKNNVTVTANATTAPDGTLTADTMVTSVGLSAQNMQTAPSGLSTTASYTFSCYVKYKDYQFIQLATNSLYNSTYVNFDLVAGTVCSGSIAGTITSVGNGWYRLAATVGTPTNSTGGIAIVFVPNASAGRLNSITGDGTSGVYIWGAQLEQSATATAYQKVVTQYEVTEAGVQSASYLAFDGVDDGMVTGTITPGIDKAQVFAGVRQLSNSSYAGLVSFGTSVFDQGTFLAWLRASSGGGQLECFAKGASSATLGDVLGNAALVVPATSVFSFLYDVAQVSVTDEIRPRQNGTVMSVTGTGSAGTGNFSTQIMTIGYYEGAQWFNGRIYSLIIRFGANLTTGQITSTESWVNGKTGAY